MRTTLPLAAVLLVTTSAIAQEGASLADTYKALCGDAAASATEACVTLGKAMSAGAGTPQGGAVLASTPELPELPAKPLAQAVAEAIAAAPPLADASLGDAAPNAEAWGPLAVLGGTYWFNETAGGIRHYRWVVPGEVLETVMTGDGFISIDRSSLDATGTMLKVVRRTDEVEQPAHTMYTPRANIIVSESLPQGWRSTERFSGTSRIGMFERFQNGAWVATDQEIRAQRISAAQAAAADRVIAEYKAAKQAYAQAVNARWGLLARQVGKSFLHTYEGTNYITSYAWKSEGRHLQTRTQGVGQTATYDTDYVYDTAKGRVVTGSGEGTSYGTVQADGSLAFVNASPKYSKYRSFIRQGPGSSFEGVSERLRGGGWQQSATSRYVEYTPEVAAALRQQLAQAEQARRVAQAKQSSGGGGGLFGALLGATMGAAMGGNAEQVMGAAIKGVQIVDPGNQMAQALGGQADAMLSGQGIASTAMNSSGIASAAMGGGGSYATRPNLALGACPGFSESNYRSVALSGGNDVQLKTMCGQAFEYYTMYKRAIAQGYSEADANRTYAAHEGAVTNLRSFAGN